MMEMQEYNAVVTMRPRKEPEGIVVTATLMFVVLAKTEKQAERHAQNIALSKYHKEYKIVSCLCTLKAPFDIQR